MEQLWGQPLTVLSNYKKHILLIQEITSDAGWGFSLAVFSCLVPGCLCGGVVQGFLFEKMGVVERWKSFSI